MHTEETVPAKATQPRPLTELTTMDDYLRDYGKVLGHKAITSLAPLHVPEQDELLEFDEMLREPFEPQKHVITATTKMLNEKGSGFLVGEMGCGKTLLGMCAIHKHARGKPYRAVVLCPDHLIAVWVEEIEETIPGAIIRRFDNWKGFTEFIDKGHEFIKDDGKFRRRIRRWSKPQGPEWYIIGRNQAKWYPDWISIGEPRVGFGGQKTEGFSHRHVVVDHVPTVDDDGRPVLDNHGRQKKHAIIDKVFVCPRCGEIPRTKQGVPMGVKELSKEQRTCDGWVLDQVPDPDRKQSGLDRLPSDGIPKLHEGKEVTIRGRKYLARKCGEPLWNYISKPYRWAPARIIQKKLRRMFKYLIIDEVHEQKSDESAQSMAAGKLMSATQHTLALTGTLIGGYANHLFPLMVRMTPKTLREEGFEWGKDLPFSQVYGRIDRIITTKQDGDGPSVGKRVVSMRKARNGKSTERQAVRPGIMPTMFGRHMIGTSLFITLEELADELPDLDEFVEDGACDMAPEVKEEYKRIEEALTSASKELLKRGSMKLLGTMLFTLLDYPDQPYGWWSEHEGEMAVGYYEKPKDYTKENWKGVVQPKDMDRETIQPKEQKLIDICKTEVAAGKQVWVYVQMTGKRNIQTRLKALLEKEGLRVGILRSDTVNPKDRKEWIDRNGPNFDVMISHPKLVSTGLTLFSKQKGGHNFSTLVFYETGYNLFDMRQAARRAWRIGQPNDCKVYYLYYRETMQHRAMQLMSRKMAAATALEGEFSTEGLVAMAGEDNAQMALARGLAERIDDSDMQRSWNKVKSGPKKVRKPTEGIKLMVHQPVTPDALDDLPDPVQMAAMTILDNQQSPAGGNVEVEIEVPDISTFGSARPGATPKLTLAYDSSEPEPEEEEEDEDTPMLSREQLAKMFQNLLANGMSLDDFR